MKNKYLKLIILALIGLLIIANNSTVISKQEQSFDRSEEVILRIKANSIFEEDKYIEMSREKVDQIILNIQKLQFDLENNKLTHKEYIKGFLEVFQNENLISNEITLDKLEKIGKIFQNNLLLNNPIIDSKNDTTDVNKGLPLHVGRSTVIASIGIGNFLVKRIIPFRPFGFYDLFNRDFLKTYNLTSTFSYASACIWTPGPKGHHVLYSLNPYPGLDILSQKIFADKAIGGIFILGINISLEAFTADYSEVLFDATIGVYGSDIMYGFSN